MKIPQRFCIHETQHWLINHRIDSALPGYVMLGAKSSAKALYELPADALAQLGGLLAKIQFEVQRILQPDRIYIGRYGHSTNYSIHFHIIPIYKWVEDLFWKDDSYRTLQAFQSISDGATDGAELTLFVWREFCERKDPPPVNGMSISDIVNALRKTF